MKPAELFALTCIEIVTESDDVDTALVRIAARVKARDAEVRLAALEEAAAIAHSHVEMFDEERNHGRANGAKAVRAAIRDRARVDKETAK